MSDIAEYTGGLYAFPDQLFAPFEEQFDSNEELKININQFKDNLAILVNEGNEKAKKILDRVQNINLT